MRSLSENIFVRLLPAFVLGIISALYVPLSSWVIWVTVIVLLLTATCYEIIPLKNRYKLQPFQGFIWLLLVFSLGHALYLSQLPKQFLSEVSERNNKLLIQIDDEPIPRNQVIKVIGKIKGVIKNDTILPFSGKCMLFVRKSEQSFRLKYNDVLICDNTLQNVERDPNPHAIDYQRILYNKGIYYTGFVNEAQYRVIKHYNGIDLYEYALNTRQYCLGILTKYISNRDAAAVCSSLLLGQRNDLSFELENAYASAGVIHILAVSGMHVGLIFLLIKYMLRITGLYKRSQLLSFIIILSFIWFFALITGLTSSVTRASAMISLVAFGAILKRPLFTINILFGSALGILCVRPTMLFDIGFQLSFSAVLGILVLQPRLYERMQTLNPLLDGIMKIMSVSIAAQAFTLPFILFYFHQIPIHFVLANLLVVPVLTFVIYALLALLLCSPLPLAAGILGTSISYVVHGINQTILYIQSLPVALLHIRSFNLFMLFLCFVFLFLLTQYMYTMRLKTLFASMLILLLLVSMNTYISLQLLNQHSIQVFRHDKGIVSAVRNRQQAVVLYPLAMNIRSGAFDHYLKQYFLYENVKEVLCIPVSSASALAVSGDWFNYNGKYLQTEDCIIETRNKEQLIQWKGKNLLCTLTNIDGDNVYNLLSKGPLLIPLSGDELPISDN